MAEHFEHISLRHRRRRRRRASVCMFIIAGEVFRLFQIYDTKSWNPNRPYIVYCARRMGMNRTEPTERRKREKTNWKHTRTKRIENSVVNALFGAIDGRSGNAHALFSGTKPCAYPHSTHTHARGVFCVGLHLRRPYANDGKRCVCARCKFIIMLHANATCEYCYATDAHQHTL